MTMLLLKRGVRRGLLTLRRERGWGTSLSALLGVVLLVQLFIVVCFAAQGTDHLLRTQSNLQVPMNRNASDHSIQEFLIAAQQHPAVAKAEYITREQALERERLASPEAAEFLEQSASANPFSDTVIVTPHSLSAFREFAAFAQQSQWRNVVDPAFLSSVALQERELNDLLNVAGTGRTISFLFLALSWGILLLVTVELVRRRAFLRRDELFVERISGAREASVVLPFATEAAVLLIIALALSTALLAAALSTFTLPLSGAGEMLGAIAGDVALRIATYGPLLFLIELLLVLPFAYIGGYLGTRVR